MLLARLPATRLAFLVSGYAISAWAPLIPSVQRRLDISTGALGLTLLWLGAGSMVTMPLAGGLIGRVGGRNLFTISGIAIAAILPCLALVRSAFALGLCLFALGAALGLISCGRNLHGLLMGREFNRHLMSSFHGFYSVGTVIGAGTMGVLMGLGLAPHFAMLVVAIVVLASVMLSAPHIVVEYTVTGPAFAWPRGAVLVVGLLCFAVFMVEGSVLDWSAILLTRSFHLDVPRAGLGYVAFATTMTVGRLTGERVIRRWGGPAAASWGALLATGGFVMAISTAHWALAIAGFALVGVGCANIVPLLYSTVGRQTIMAQNLALATAGSVGFLGILTGPAAIGIIAQWTSLNVAFLVLATVLLVVAWIAPRILINR